MKLEKVEWLPHCKKEDDVYNFIEFILNNSPNKVFVYFSLLLLL